MATVLESLQTIMPADEAEEVTTDLENQFMADGYGVAVTSAGVIHVRREGTKLRVKHYGKDPKQ